MSLCAVLTLTKLTRCAIDAASKINNNLTTDIRVSLRTGCVQMRSVASDASLTWLSGSLNNQS